MDICPRFEDALHPSDFNPREPRLPKLSYQQDIAKEPTDDSLKTTGTDSLRTTGCKLGYNVSTDAAQQSVTQDSSMSSWGIQGSTSVADRLREFRIHDSWKTGSANIGYNDAPADPAQRSWSSDRRLQPGTPRKMPFSTAEVCNNEQEPLSSDCTVGSQMAGAHELKCTMAFPPDNRMYNMKAGQPLQENALIAEAKHDYSGAAAMGALPNASIEPVLEGEHVKSAFVWNSPSMAAFPPHHSYKSETTVHPQTLVASNVVDSHGFIGASTTHQDEPNVGFSSCVVSFKQEEHPADTSMRTDSSHDVSSADEWAQVRMVGKSQSMRVLNSFNEENEALRRALHAMRRSGDQPTSQTPLREVSNQASSFPDPMQRAYFSTNRHLLDDMFEPRTMSMREPRKWGMGGGIGVFSPASVGEAPQLRPAYPNFCNNCNIPPLLNSGNGGSHSPFAVYDHAWQYKLDDPRFHRKGSHNTKSNWMGQPTTFASQTPYIDARFPFCNGGSHISGNRNCPPFQGICPPSQDQMVSGGGGFPSPMSVMDGNKEHLSRWQFSDCESPFSGYNEREFHSAPLAIPASYTKRKGNESSIFQQGKGLGIVRPATPGRSQSMRYGKISFADHDWVKESRDGSAKIDGTRSQSLREGQATEQCSMCGQRLWVVLDKTLDLNPKYLYPQVRLCASCHPRVAFASNYFAAPPLAPRVLHQQRSSARPGAAATAASFPPPPPSTISMGCKPSATRKKKNRIVQLCRQFLGLAIKT
eukprot:c6347_g1_i1 orf=131-2395(+)